MDQRLIVIAPGWGSFDLSWIKIQEEFQKLGFDVIIFNYEDRGLGDISENAQKIKEILEHLRNQYSHITFIGHSMGGLIGRYIIQILSGYHLIDAYISIGTPHKGTHLAKVVTTKITNMFMGEKKYIGQPSISALQMLPGSEFLNSLNISDWPDKIPTLSFSGGLDWILFNHNTSKFQEKHVHINNATHTSLMMHPRLTQEIFAFLIYEVFNEVGFITKNGIIDTIIVKNNEKVHHCAQKIQKTALKALKNTILWLKASPDHILHKKH